MTACIITFSLTCVAMIACVLTGAEIKIKNFRLPLYFTVTLLGAIIMLVSGMLPVSFALESLLSDSSVNPLKILVLFLSMTVLSIFLDETGFFSYLADVALKKSGKSQIKLFIILYVVVSLLTSFTSNDIVILTFTPFICYFCRRANVNPLPYLIEEFVAANTFSMLLVIGNPTNIYLALSQELTFFGYLAIMWLPTILAGMVAFFVMLALFYKQLKLPLERTSDKSVPIDKPLAVIGGIHLVACTLLLSVSDFFSLPMWGISLAFALSLFITVTAYKLVKREPFLELSSTLKRAPWGFIPFLLSMFLLVCALEYNGVTKILAGLLSNELPILTYGAISTLFCSFVNNIPMSVLFASVLSFSSLQRAAVFACIVGSNLGAFLTPVGALAGIMFSNIVKTQNVKLSFARFTLYGTVIALPTLAFALLGLYIIL